ncbi:MAG TPA: glycosyltransferase [Kiritimatiellia bacterium]|nr:glycosyltransferase [Kiritimatiellia bacterium]HSA17450.1 glycosyltransferase [Kiritimatiellia bacterium]
MNSADSGKRIDGWLIAILAAAAFLLFFRLDHRPFWQDEAETACLARNVLRFGLPLAFDGVNLVSQEENREFGPDHVWRWSPWLQIYLMAASFRIGGETTLAGRLPFAFCGWLTLWLVYRWVRRLSGDVAWARWSAALLALSVPFLLFARQGRYTGPAMLLTMLIVPAAFRPSRAALAVALPALGALFHLNYIVFAGLLGGLLPLVWLERRQWTWLRLAAAATVLALFIAPGIAGYHIGSRAGLMDWSMAPVRLQRNLVDVLQFALPLPLAAAVLLRGRTEPGATGEPIVRRLLILVAGSLLTVSLAPREYFRYLVPLLPLCAIVCAWCLRTLWAAHRAPAVLLGVLLVFTNWLHVVPLDRAHVYHRPWHNDPAMLTAPNFPMKLFLTELCRGYPDVHAAAIARLNEAARPGDTVLATYGDLPLQFYTRCRVTGGFQRPEPEPGIEPDWVIVRRRTFLTRDNDLPASRRQADALELERDYERIVLPAPDDPFGNRPDPAQHRFLPPREPFEHLVLYRRKEGA